MGKRSTLSGFLLATLTWAPWMPWTPGCAVPDARADRELQHALDELAARAAPAEVAIACRDLATGREWLVRPDEEFHAASTMKVAVLVELFRQADAGRLALDEPIRLSNSFASIVDGTPYALDPAEDEDPTLYDQLGRTVATRELARRMIVRSSNLATNTLIARVGADSVQTSLRELGLTRMRVLRGVEDLKAWEAGLNNVVTARDLMQLFVAIAEERAARPEGCEAMLALLQGQELDDMLPRGLPPGTRIAHKTGSITGAEHDAGIVFPAEGAPYVLVVLTRGFEEPAAAKQAGADVARVVHDQLTNR